MSGQVELSGGTAIDLRDVFDAAAISPPAETHEDMPLLQRRDLKTFDSDAKQLVLDYQEAGWRGYKTSRGHAFMLAPDGKTTANVSRESLRGRSGANARAALTAWKRRHLTGPGSAFGLVAVTLADFVKGAERILAEAEDGLAVSNVATDSLFKDIATNPQARDWFIAHPRAEDTKRLYMVGLVNGELPPPGCESKPDVGHWALFDVIRKYEPVLVAFGDHVDEAMAWAWLHHDAPHFFAPDAPADTHEETSTGMATVYVCTEDGCDKSYATPNHLNLHTMRAHAEPLTCPVAGCGRVVKGGNASMANHMKTHAIKVAPLETPMKDKPVREVPTPKTEALPPADRPHSVVSDYLESVPEGIDAEQMVARVRALVAPTLVEEVQRLTADNARLTTENTQMASRLAETEARLALMREALGA